MKVKLMYPFLKISQELYDLMEPKLCQWKYIRKLSILQEQLHPYLQPRQALRNYLVSKLAMSLGMLFGLVIFAIVLALLPQQNEFLEAENQILRNNYGMDEQRRTLYVQIGERKAEALEFGIQPRAYSKMEVEQLFENKKEVLEEVLLGQNESAAYVTKDLLIPSYLPGTGLELQWLMSRADLVDYEGRLLGAELSEEGEELQLTAVLHYEQVELQHIYVFRIYDGSEEGDQLLQQLKQTIERIDENTKEHEHLKLPTSIDGEAIRYSEEKDASSGLLLMLGAAVVLVFFGKDADLKKEVTARERQMVLDYSGVVRKLMLLMKAGLTVRGAFFRITEDYYSRAANGKTGRRYAYEEMVVACRNLQSGMSEYEVYERFGRRCRVQCYMRFGTLLTQSLRKGTAYLQEQLLLEAADAMEARKQTAKLLGAELETKLLFPMVLLLGVVVVVLVVPAFMSMSV